MNENQQKTEKIKNTNRVYSLSEVILQNNIILNDLVKSQIELTRLCIEEKHKHLELLKKIFGPLNKVNKK